MSADRLAFLFPGQGSQHPGMGRAVHDAYEEARRAFEEADAALPEPISRLCFEGGEDELRRTENTQPAILATSIAVLGVLQSRGLRAGWVAGHSLGEYSALVAARVLELADAVRLVRKRGRYMQEAVPEGAGAMAAVLGLGDDAVEGLCAAWDGEGVVEVANLNAPGQVVVAGDRTAVRGLVERASAAGAKRAVLLNVSAPFHCSLMQPAADRLRQDLAAVAFHGPSTGVVCNVDARPLEGGEAARDKLARQVTAPVRWAETLQYLRAAGVDTFVEVGPGRVLSGLVRRTLGREVAIHAVEEPETIDAVADLLAGVGDLEAGALGAGDGTAGEVAAGGAPAGDPVGDDVAARQGSDE